MNYNGRSPLLLQFKGEGQRVVNANTDDRVLDTGDISPSDFPAELRGCAGPISIIKIPAPSGSVYPLPINVENGTLHLPALQVG